MRCNREVMGERTQWPWPKLTSPGWKKQLRAEDLMSRRRNLQKQIRSQMWVSTPLVRWLKSWLHYRLPHSHDSKLWHLMFREAVWWTSFTNQSVVWTEASLLPCELQNAINNFAPLEFNSLWSPIMVVTLLLLLPPLLLTGKCLRLMLMIKMWVSCFHDFC